MASSLYFLFMRHFESDECGETYADILPTITKVIASFQGRHFQSKSKVTKDQLLLSFKGANFKMWPEF